MKVQYSESSIEDAHEGAVFRILYWRRTWKRSIQNPLLKTHMKVQYSESSIEDAYEGAVFFGIY